MKIKCPNCGQTLLHAVRVVGTIKCPRCKKIIDLNHSEDRANSRTEE